MVGNTETPLQSNALLAPFNFVVVKFFHQTAVKTYQVIVVRSFIQFKYGLAGFEMIAMEESGLLELREHTIHGSESHIHVVGKQDLVDIFGTQVPHIAVVKDIQNLDARQRNFQAAGFDVGWIIGHVLGGLIGICFII